MPPFFSICVPQYNRTSFLIKALEVLQSQSYRDFEVCISDGGSTDGRIDELDAWLQKSGMEYHLARTIENLQYDPNTRKAIGLARGRYVMLMGNDDALNGDDALERLHRDIVANEYPGVIISDFCDDRTDQRAHRIRAVGLFPAGPDTASLHFRNFSFVSGLTMDRAECHRFETAKWDGSEMYQTYIGCSMIAGGRTLLERVDPFVRKDLVITGESVDSYATRKRIDPCPIQERSLPLGKLARVVSDAIGPYAGAQRKSLNFKILFQLLGFTYPFWLFEYRRVQSWNYAAGIALGMRPSRTAYSVELGWIRRPILWSIYLTVTLLGLTLPIGFFRKMQSTLYRIAKR